MKDAARLKKAVRLRSVQTPELAPTSFLKKLPQAAQTRPRWTPEQ